MCKFEQFRVFGSGEDIVFSHFDTLEDLLNLEFVRRYTQKPEYKALCLNHKSLCVIYDINHQTVAQTIGYLDTALDLPSILDYLKPNC